MLRDHPLEPVPTETARVAKAAFPAGHRYLRLADELGTRFTTEMFAPLYSSLGQPALPPWRLALVTICSLRKGYPTVKPLMPSGVELIGSMCCAST